MWTKESGRRRGVVLLTCSHRQRLGPLLLMGETERRRGVMLVLTLKNEDSDDMRRHCLDNMAHQRMCHVVAIRC
jgi:hypothetical protein